MKKLLSLLVGFICISSLSLQDSQEEITPEARTAIEKGINWLKENQNKDGSWGCEKNQPPSVACTALTMLVFMSTGTTLQRGPYSEPLRKGLDWLKTKGVREKDGFMSAYDSTGMGNVFEHACGVLVLAHLFGSLKDSTESGEVKGILKRGLLVLEKMQNSDGGWPKNPKSGPSDSGVTALCYMAIRAANKAGVSTDKADLDALLKLAKKFGGSKDGEGGTLYGIGAALRIFYGLGSKNDSDAKSMLKKAIDFNYNYRGGGLSEWDYAGFYLSTAALFHDDKSDTWKQWYKKTSKYLIENQKPDGKDKGYWVIQYCLNCKCYATDLAVLCMIMPERLLPVNEY